MHTNQPRYESLNEPLDEEEAMLMDPDSWDWETAEEGGPSPDPHLIFPIRLSGDEVRAIERAAVGRGMTVSAFLKHVALECALQDAAR